MLYTLCMDCPVPWPEFPVYPVDPTNAQSGPATSSQVPLDVFPGFASTQPKSSPHKSSSDSLRGLVLKCLYSSDDGSLAMDRISRFITRVRRRNFDLLALQGVSEPTKELEDKFRSIMKALETLEQSAQTRQVLEALADNTILDNEECIKVQQAYSAWISNRESQKIKQTVREWVNNLELLAHEIQAILVLQMITLLQGIESTKTLRESLEFITDRLAIRQAMQGLTLDLNQDSTEGSTQDEVQQFWSLVEQSFDFKPSFWESHRNKLFPDSLFSDFSPALPATTPPSPPKPLPPSDSDAESQIVSAALQQQVKKRSDVHPTPDLARLAARAQDLKAQQEQEASARMPASPTLAKLLGNASRESSLSTVSTTTTNTSTHATNGRRGTFKRANSMTMNAPNLAGRKPLSREVSMRQRTASVEPQPVPVKSGQTQEADVGKKLRVNKRKQLSPKKHVQGPSAKSGQGLLVHSKTPAKLKIRPKGQRAQSFADLGRMFRPGSALLAPPSSDAYFDMLELEDDAARDDDEDDSMDLLSGASPVSKRTSNTTLFRHKT